MSNPTSSSRLVPKKTSNPQPLQTENEFETSSNSIHFPPPRTPLNTIPDPSQYQKETSILYSDKESLEGAVNRAFGTKFEGLDQWTPRVSSHRGKGTSEQSSAQSTPARSSSRVSIGGAGGNSRASQCGGAKGGLSFSFSYRVPRGVQNRDVEVSKEVPHFELEEDCSFWADHNVQVLIRVRPLNYLERASQGYGRCLRQESAQTLAWLGHPETRFTFDHVACETISQEKLFQVAGLPMVENCLSGYNSCMFAYGQTGSGKTYTMMGEIHEAEDKLSEYRGMTPRIFEHLFMRIRKDEESRRDEKLIYSCKCSLLEIYNEQITDLLEPSSTNLQLREDMNKGVYVENLTEHSVRTVGDVIKLLVQGTANRKMAATHMNSESSRSHSVFTCIIESCWEKDSMSHFRFARLNLVDLAGSERQKSSGAEGDRLKEAANINKSLSTLGLVIMSLVDLAHGKHRHIPYRDSRLTFLLQDSLGGNSKTMIIANVSPSICSASETLSTLKFAQRAKLIQNNAKVNEDASSDVSALQLQVQQLKDQLSSLMKYYVRPSSDGGQCTEHSLLHALVGEYPSLRERIKIDNSNFHCIGGKEHIESLQTTLVNSLRRERMAEIEVTKLKAEIERINILVCKMQEDAKRTDMVLKFREEKIKRLELLVDGKLSAKKYLMEENTALVEEIHLLQERIKNNPETTQFALEKNRLLEQLQIYQNFVDQGERETLLLEVSDLRNQLLNLLEGNWKNTNRRDTQDMEELAECRRMNSELIREVEELRVELQKSYCSTQGTYDFAEESFSKDFEEVRQLDKYSQNSEVQQDMVDARQMIDVMEAEQVQLIKELQLIKEENLNLKALLSEKEQAVDQSPHKYANHSVEPDASWNMSEGLSKYSIEESEGQALPAKLHKIKQELERITSHVNQRGEEVLSQPSCLNDYSIFQQVEMETAKTILNLQDEISALQFELHEKLSSLTQENLMLRETIAVKQEEFDVRGEEWEKGILELTTFLADSSRSLKDASSQVASIAGSFPQVNDWIKEHVERAVTACIEKEEAVLLLQRSLENARKTVMDMELKLNSLKGATLSLGESQHMADEESTREVTELYMKLDEKINLIKMLQEDMKKKNKHIDGSENHNEVLLVFVKWLLDSHTVPQRHISVRSMEENSKLANYFEDSNKEVPETMPEAPFLEMEHVNAQAELARQSILELQNAITACHEGAEITLSAVRDEICKGFSSFRELIRTMSREMNDIRIQLTELRSNCEREPNVQTLSVMGVKPQDMDHCCHVLYQIRDGLAETNTRLKYIKDRINMLNLCGCLAGDGGLIEANEMYSDCSTSDSEFSRESTVAESCRSICSSKLTGKPIQLLTDSKLKCDAQSHHLEAGAVTNSFHEAATVSCVREDLETAFAAFNKQYAQLILIFNEMDAGSRPFRKGNQTVSYSVANSKSNDGYQCEGEVMDFSHANRFLNKFEEANATIKEADVMLNALLKANEDAKTLTDVWKQASEALAVEKANLNEEVKLLQSSLKEKEKENKSFDDYVHAAFLEIATTVSSMEEQFLQVQKYAFHMFEVIHSDVLTLGHDLLHLIHNSRLSVEEVSSQMVEKGFTQFLLYQCLISELIYKSSQFWSEFGTNQCKHQEHPVRESDPMIGFNGRGKPMIIEKKSINGSKQHELVASFCEGEASEASENLFNENVALREELNRKGILLEGLLFDISLLQESASNTKEIKDETQKLVTSLRMVQKELDTKKTQLNHIMTERGKLESQFRTTEEALRQSISDLQQANKTIDALSDQNHEMKALIKDLYARESQAKQQLEEQKEVIRGLDEEILHLTSSMESKLLSSIGGIEDDLKVVTGERDHLRDEVCSLSNKLDLVYSLADENEAIAVEARQESEAHRIYAEQKEEEVKILEHSVEELEHTINVLEKKVSEMDHDVERYRLIRDSLELEIQALRERLSVVENFTENLDSDSNGVDCFEDQATRETFTGALALCGAQRRIKHLELEKSELEREIRECKEYISEVELHAEAQASQYQQKYKSLEAMVDEVRNNLLNSASNAPAIDKNDSSSQRTRGSSSPFRCISNVIQQMNMEKEQELTTARLRIQELEALAASQQEEVCMLNTRLAASESMTHDVIRDLLSVKLDMTNYANLIEQHNIQKFVKAAYQQTEEYQAKEQEVLQLRKQIKDLIEERDSCMDEVNRREADMLAAHVTFEQHKQREQLLTAQNEMLKMDKANLKRRVAELDEVVKKLSAPQSTLKALHQKASTKENSSPKAGITHFNSRIAKSEKLLCSLNDELAQYQNSSKYFMEKTRGRGSDIEDRK